MTSKPDVRVRRAYDEVEDQDAVRVLVDRLWPRGIRKVDAHLDEWCKEIAPSEALRKWYGHDSAKFEEFRRRYQEELEQLGSTEALKRLRELANHRQPEFFKVDEARGC